LKEIIIGLKGHVDLFQKIRIVKPSPVERQCSPEIHHRTAPDESANAKDALPAYPVFDGSGQGAFNKQVRIFDAALLKEIYMALLALFSKL